MQAIAKILAPIALIATILPAVLYAFKAIEEGPLKLTMLLATIVWFAFSPFWLKGGSE
jgi:hypothetical protein